MTATAKPATPLPWKHMIDKGRGSLQFDRFNIYTLADNVPAHVRDMEKQDAAYIVTACNAYPQLVEDLAELRALQVNGFDPLAAARDYERVAEDRRRLVEALRGIERSAMDEGGDQLYVSVAIIKSARALLRELYGAQP